MPTHDRSFLEAALVGFQHKLAEIEKAMRELKRRLGNKTGGPTLLPSLAALPRNRGRRRVSAASRKKMAEAQKRRWAKVKKAKVA